MIKEHEVTKTVMEPESIECDCCHKVITAEDCAECLYSQMTSIEQMKENILLEFHLCDECLDDIITKNNIQIKQTNVEMEWQ